MLGQYMSLRVTVGSLDVIASILVNLGHLIGQLRVGKGYLMVTVSQQG